MNKNIKLLSLIFLGFSSAAFAQIREEKLILTKKREPEVKKIEKKKTSVEVVKNYPPEEKSATPVEYKITDVPAVSDFKTSTIQSQDVVPVFNAQAQDNYFQIGLGNYGKFLADGNISARLQEKIEVGADVHVLSTNGLKKDYPWDSSQRNLSLGAFINAYGEKGKANANVEYVRDDYHYYGIYSLAPAADIDLSQNVNQVRANGYYDFYSNQILNDVRVKTNFLSDHFNAKENQVALQANLSKHGVDISEEIKMNADLGLALENVQSDFKLLDRNNTTYLNFEVAPKVTFRRGEHYLKLGSGFSFLRSTANSLQKMQEAESSRSFWFPQAEFQVAASQEFKFYGGVDGGLHLNTYSELLEKNPFLVSDQILKPTETKYRFYAGMRGDFSETVKYDFSAGFSKVNNVLFFRANPLFDNAFTLDRFAFDYANTFSAVYDSGNLSDIKASVQYFPLANLALDAEVRFLKYDLENFSTIYNVPLVSGSIGAKYSLLQKKLLLGFKGIFATDRTTNSYSFIEAGNPVQTFQVEEDLDEKVGGFADINLSAEYKVHKNFSIFALGNNLLSSKYETYKGYKVLGAQILGGVKISF